MAFTVRTDAALEAALDALVARSHGASRQEIVRRAVLELYDRTAQDEQVAASADRMIAKWGDVLDRLGNA